jgi:hypothetical protein
VIRDGKRTIAKSRKWLERDKMTLEEMKKRQQDSDEDDITLASLKVIARP